MSIDPSTTSLDVIVVSGFHGTAIFRYTIDDFDPTTNSASAEVTVQVVDFVGGVEQPVVTGAFEKRDQAQLSVNILTLNPATKTYQPATLVNVGDLILVQVTSLDLRPAQHVTAVTNVLATPTPTSTSF